MSDVLYDEIQREVAKYPDRRSAILPALRHAQEHYGWLSPEALASELSTRRARRAAAEAEVRALTARRDAYVAAHAKADADGAFDGEVKAAVDRALKR